jgi:hypothetical protein
MSAAGKGKHKIKNQKAKFLNSTRPTETQEHSVSDFSAQDE